MDVGMYFSYQMVDGLPVFYRGSFLDARRGTQEFTFVLHIPEPFLSFILYPLLKSILPFLLFTGALAAPCSRISMRYPKSPTLDTGQQINDCKYRLYVWKTSRSSSSISEKRTRGDECVPLFLALMG